MEVVVARVNLDPTVQSTQDLEERTALGTVLQRLTGRQLTTTLGRYRLQERVGSGGCGVVYQAHDPDLDRDVAVKLVQTAAAHEGHARERLVREAQSLAKLGHPNVVQIFDVGTDRRDLYIVMELLRGPTLEVWAREDGRTVEQIVDAYLEAAEGLAAAHAVGVIHRDFKPANAMFGADGRVKVLDFGLARDDGAVTDPNDDDDALMHASLTLTGVVMGTPRYMAPEQHRAEPVTERSDQYALCVALWEAIAGTPPFAGATVADLAVAKTSGMPPRPDRMPAWLYAVLSRGLDPDPTARHADVRELAAALSHRGGRRRGRWAAALVGAALLGTAGFAYASQRAPAACTRSTADWQPQFATVVERTTPPRTHDAWGVQVRIAARLDRFDEQWALTRDRVCAADNPDNARQREQTACLTRAADRFQSTLDDLAAARQLPSIDQRRRVLDRRSPSRGEGEDADELFWPDPARDAELAQLDTLSNEPDDDADTSGRDDELAAGIERAEALGSAWVASRLARAKAGRRTADGHTADAVKDLERATWFAEAEGDTLLAAELFPEVLAYMLDAGNDPADVDRGFAHARELAEAAGNPLAPRVKRLVVEALHEMRRSNSDKCAALSQEALDLAGDPPPPGTERLVALGTITTVGLTHEREGTMAAMAQLERVLRMGEASQDEWFPAVAAMTHDMLSSFSLEIGDQDRALRERLAQIDQLTHTTKDGNPPMMFAVSAYGRMLTMRGADTEGIALMRHGYQWIHDGHGALHAKLGHIAADLAEAQAERGRPDEALAWAKRALDHAERQYGAEHIGTAWARAELARAYLDLGRTDEAREAVASYVAVLDEDPEERQYATHLQGRLALADGDFRRARDLLVTSLGLIPRGENGISSSAERGYVYAHLGASLRGLGELDDARAVELLAAEAFDHASWWDRQRAREIREHHAAEDAGT